MDTTSPDIFPAYISSIKKEMTLHIHSFFSAEKQTFSHIQNIGSDAANRLEQFVINGKMTRAALVYIGAEIAGIDTKGNKDLATIALAMELFQSGFLIHDDIIDNDEMRRGLPSIHTQYTQLLTQMQSRYPKNSGKALGIQIGDIAFFLGYKAIGEIADRTIKNTVLAILTPEMMTVALGQMQDVMMSVSNKPVSDEKQIIDMYMQKTGRYSISLPLHLGLILSHQTPETIRHIYTYGNNIGVAYQITDDMLNIFGTPKITGKPLGSDIREGKQTLWLNHLLRKSTQKETDSIKALWEQGSIDDIQALFIKDLIKKYSIDELMKTIQNTYIQKAHEAIEKIPLRPETRNKLASFTQFVTNRVQ